MPRIVVTKKRAESESEEEINHAETLKLAKSNLKEEVKAGQQSNLGGFFGLQKQPSSKFQGTAKYDSFQTDQVSIWHWNINGLNAVCERGDLQEFLKKTNPDILCLNEIKMDYEKMDKMNYHKMLPSEYEQYWNCCKVKKGYAGTAILTKVKPLSVTYDLGISKHDGEGRVVTAEFKEFILVSTYVPNSGDGLKRLKYRVNEWDQDFQKYLTKLRDDKKKPLILSGDLNVAHLEIDVHDPKGKDKVACFTP